MRRCKCKGREYRDVVADVVGVVAGALALSRPRHCISPPRQNDDGGGQTGPCRMLADAKQNSD
jgi:hypothetical protein